MTPRSSKITRTIILLALTLGLTASLFGQFPIKIPKIPKINIEKPTTSPDTSSTTGEMTSSPASSNSTENEWDSPGKIVPGAKLQFSTTPFSSGAAAKTNFKSSDHIYARLDLGGKTVYDAFGLKGLGERASYYLYVSTSISKDRVEWHSHWSNYDAIILVTKDDANKTYLDLDIAPDPTKLTPTWFCGTTDSSQYCSPGAGVLYGYHTRDVDSASRAFPTDGTYYIDLRVWIEGFDAWGKQVSGRNNYPSVGGVFTYQFSMQDGQTLVANSKKASASAEIAMRAKEMLHAMPDFWGKYPTPPDPNFAPARLVPMIKGAIGQSNIYLKHSIFSYSGPLWVVQKDEFNLPRYKWAVPAIYVIYKDTKENACKIGYFSMHQDYTGGGTYGEAFLGYIKDEKDIDCAVVR